MPLSYECIPLRQGLSDRRMVENGWDLRPSTGGAPSKRYWTNVRRVAEAMRACRAMAPLNLINASPRGWPGWSSASARPHWPLAFLGRESSLSAGRSSRSAHALACPPWPGLPCSAQYCARAHPAARRGWGLPRHRCPETWRIGPFVCSVGGLVSGRTTMANLCGSRGPLRPSLKGWPPRWSAALYPR